MPVENANSTCSIDSVSKFTDWSTFDQNRTDTSTEAILEYNGNHVDEPDTNNATAVRYDEMEAENGLEISYWKRLSQYNTGLKTRRKDGYNSKYLTYGVNKHLLEALMCQLGLRQFQQNQVYPYVMGINFREFGRKAEVTTFCAIAAVIHINTERNCHPAQDELDDEVERLLNELEISQDVYESEFGKHAHNIRNWSNVSSDRYRKFEKRRSNKFYNR
jgi:hypothetical protein